MIDSTDSLAARAAWMPTVVSFLFSCTNTLCKFTRRSSGVLLPLLAVQPGLTLC